MPPTLMSRRAQGGCDRRREATTSVQHISCSFKGVRFVHGRWVAKLWGSGRSTILGRYTTAEEAARAWCVPLFITHARRLLLLLQYLHGGRERPALTGPLLTRVRALAGERARQGRGCPGGGTQGPERPRCRSRRGAGSVGPMRAAAAAGAAIGAKESSGRWCCCCAPGGLLRRQQGRRRLGAAAVFQRRVRQQGEELDKSSFALP